MLEHKDYRPKVEVAKWLTAAFARGQRPGRGLQILLSLLLCGSLLTSCSDSQIRFQVKPGFSPTTTASDQLVTTEPEASQQAEPADSQLGEGTESQAQGNPAYSSRDWFLQPAKLEAKFRQLEVELGIAEEDIGYVFLDLESEEYWGKNLDRPFLAASVIKLPAALLSYEWAAAGKLDLSLPVTIEEEDLELGTGPISAAGAGLTYTVEELIQASIVHSDNTAFLALDRLWRQMGWLVSTMDIRYKLHYGNARELTPKECLNFLWEFYDNPQQIPAYATLDAYMRNTSYPAMAAAYIADPVARKYGKNGGYYHDVGIVYAERPFAFAIFTKNLAYPAEAIGQLNFAFYQYLQELAD